MSLRDVLEGRSAVEAARTIERAVATGSTAGDLLVCDANAALSIETGGEVSVDSLTPGVYVFVGPMPDERSDPEGIGDDHGPGGSAGAAGSGRTDAGFGGDGADGYGDDGDTGSNAGAGTDAGIDTGDDRAVNGGDRGPSGENWSRDDDIGTRSIDRLVHRTRSLPRTASTVVTSRLRDTKPPDGSTRSCDRNRARTARGGVGARGRRSAITYTTFAFAAPRNAGGAPSRTGSIDGNGRIGTGTRAPRRPGSGHVRPRRSPSIGPVRSSMPTPTARRVLRRFGRWDHSPNPLSARSGTGVRVNVGSGGNPTSERAGPVKEDRLRYAERVVGLSTTHLLRPTEYLLTEHYSRKRPAFAVAQFGARSLNASSIPNPTMTEPAAHRTASVTRGWVVSTVSIRPETIASVPR